MIVFGLTLFFITAARGASYVVFPTQVTVIPGEGVVLQVLPADDPLQTCSVRFGGYTVQLVPGVSNVSMGVSYWGRGLEQGDCGAVVHKCNDTLHSGSWVFQLLTASGKSRTAMGTITVQTSDGGSASHLTLITEMGKEIIVPCGSDDAFYCKLSNTNNETVSSGTNCTLFIPSIKMADVGLWQCAEGVSTAIHERVTYINVTVHASKKLEIGKNETTKETVIFCNHVSRNITYCRFERPDGKAFVLSDGRNINRYTYSGRGISSNDCGLSIEKPLEKTDLGTWMCTLGLEDGGRSGGFVTLTDGGVHSSKRLRTMKSKSVSTLTGTPLTLDCSVDTALNYCWFKHPNGTRYNPHPDSEASSWQYHGDSLLLGQCGITLYEAQVSDSGTWTCNMGVQNEGEASQDLQQTFKVKVADIPFVENSAVTTAMTGDWATLGCHSLQGEALHYCSFLAPNGTGYNLTPGQGWGRFTYQGLGLEYGDCGILINPVRAEDYGTWQCGAMLAATKDGEELIRNLVLEAPSLLSSSSIGLVVGVLVAAGLVVGLVIYRHRQRTENSRAAGEVRRPIALSALSDASDEMQIGGSA